MQEIKYIKAVLNLYTSILGKCINAKKSNVFILNTPKKFATNIIYILGFTPDVLPSSYLGIPFFRGSNKAAYWNQIVERIKSRISVWKVRWLSLSGRILLIKSVLAAIPNYCLSILQAPRSIIHQLAKIIKSFLWSNKMIGTKNIPLISLQEMALQYDEGGAGLHDLSF